MIIHSVNLETVIGVTTKSLPKTHAPEFAFAGRSNVGKSTLINALMNRKAYARVSEKPGKTQTVNWYRINEGKESDHYLVDLPGYGYAAARADIKSGWGKMIEGFLRKSENLRIIFLLVDIRHDPTGDDCMMYDWIVSNGFVPVIIATKLDKLKRSQVAAAKKNVEKVLKEKSLHGREVSLKVIPFSGVTKDGRDEIWAVMDAAISAERAEGPEEETTDTQES